MRLSKDFTAASIGWNLCAPLQSTITHGLAPHQLENPMSFSLRVLSAIALLAFLSGCSSLIPKPVVYQTEKFDTTEIYTRRFQVSAEVACEAARRALLSQGYVINAAGTTQIDARKSFQPENDVHSQIGFRIVCADDGHNGKLSSMFANALEDRYALKKINSAASLGVGVLGSLSVPFSSSDDSLVKVASQTVTAESFYARFFTLVSRYLGDDTEIESAEKLIAPPTMPKKTATAAVEPEPVATPAPVQTTATVPTSPATSTPSTTTAPVTAPAVEPAPAAAATPANTSAPAAAPSSAPSPTPASAPAATPHSTAPVTP
jgi:hypothetical protein